MRVHVCVLHFALSSLRAGVFVFRFQGQACWFLVVVWPRWVDVLSHATLPLPLLVLNPLVCAEPPLCVLCPPACAEPPVCAEPPCLC